MFQPTPEEIIEGISKSQFFVFVVGSDVVNAHVSVQIGAAILLDKPILLLVHKDFKVPVNLSKAAKMIHRCDMDDERQRARAHQAIMDFANKGFSVPVNAGQIN